MATTPGVGATPPATTAPTTAGNKNAALNKDDFLKLLVTQLRFQDPMQPMEDKEFIAQMAQFNTLEQMQQLNKNFTEQSDFNQLTQASGLIGKTVAIKTDSEHFAGHVVEVRRVDSKLKLMVQPVPQAGGAPEPARPYDFDQIDQVTA